MSRRPKNSIQRPFKSISSLKSSSFSHRLKSFFLHLRTLFSSKLTVMLVPHTEKKVFSFKISVWLLSFFSALAVLLVAAFVGLAVFYSGSSHHLSENKKQLSMVEQHNRNYYQAIKNFNKPYKSFETVLNRLLESSLPPNRTDSPYRQGDYLDIDIIEETREGQTPLTSVLQSATEDIEVYTKALLEQAAQKSKINELLKVIPAKWPIINNHGRITAHFGPAPHPIKGGWYLHTGIDIAYDRGTPLIATGNGKVVEQQFSRDYGNYIIIRHEYGFYTKYAHMDNTYVKEGDTVTQGQIIGTLGNTGLSTGPHIHYEIMINSQNIDPFQYINLLTQ